MLIQVSDYKFVDSETGQEFVCIYPEECGDGDWGLYAPELDEWHESLFDSTEEALEGAMYIWPSNSVWAGRPTPDGKGWMIAID